MSREYQVGDQFINETDTQEYQVGDQFINETVVTDIPEPLPGTRDSKSAWSLFFNN